ncbi:MAG TPA: ribonuclease H family protein [Chloroflexia bacterium]|nr:ribonuclease H family protein [Chloroflexia bacterium]
MTDAVVYSDGSRLRDNGPVGWGCQVLVEHKRLELSGTLDSSSTLLAELHAAYKGIELAIEHHASHVVVYTDCLSLIELLKGRAQRPLQNPIIAAEVAQVKAWEEQVEIRWVWAKSHHRHGSGGNERADYLAKQALLKEQA